MKNLVETTILQMRFYAKTLAGIKGAELTRSQLLEWADMMEGELREQAGVRETRS